MRIASILLCTALLAAGEPAPAPAAAAGELVAVPVHVQRSTSLWFDEGRLQGGQDNLSLGLQAKLADRIRIIEVLGVDLVEAIGDDGKPLRLQEDGGSSGGGGGDPGQLTVSVSFDPPAPTVRTLKSLVVAVRCRTAAETLRRTTLRPAKDWIAKRMRVEGVEGGEIELENLGAESLTLGMSPALERAIETLHLKNAAGDDIEQQGWNDSQEPGWIARVMQASLPADGAIILDLRQDLGEKRYVLRGVNLPIALPDRAKEPVGVLKSEEIKDGEANVEIAPVPVALPKPGF